MRLRAKKFFVSTSLGNVDDGKIFEEKNDERARRLIEAGLVEKVEPLDIPVFQEPAVQIEENESGLSSQAGQVSVKPIVPKRKPGVRRRRKKSAK